MKRIMHTSLFAGVFVLVSAFFAGCTSSGAYQEQKTAAPNSGQYMDYNVDELDSYGQWYTLPPYGDVWRPNVEQDWRPFYYGHWDYTPPNWTWISYEPFGWIVYHYGSWLYTGTYGWVWIPGGGAWSPATVEWISYDDYVGWAPRPPRGVVLPRPWERDQQGMEVWNVVHARDFADDNVGRERLEGAVVRPRDSHEQMSNRLPDPRAIERSTGRPVPSVTIPREPVKVGRQQLHRMKVPPADKQRAEQHRAEVEKHVTRNAGNQKNTGTPRETGNRR